MVRGAYPSISHSPIVATSWERRGSTFHVVFYVSDDQVVSLSPVHDNSQTVSPTHPPSPSTHTHSISLYTPTPSLSTPPLHLSPHTPTPFSPHSPTPPRISPLTSQIDRIIGFGKYPALPSPCLGHWERPVFTGSWGQIPQSDRPGATNTLTSQIDRVTGSASHTCHHPVKGSSWCCHIQVCNGLSRESPPG